MQTHRHICTGTSSGSSGPGQASLRCKVLYSLSRQKACVLPRSALFCPGDTLRLSWSVVEEKGSILLPRRLGNLCPELTSCCLIALFLVGDALYVAFSGQMTLYGEEQGEIGF